MDTKYTSENLNSLINGNRHIVVVDIEHSCTEDDSIPPEARETIEIGAVLIDTRSFHVVEEFNSFIRPIIHPEISQFCTNLTGIKQCQLDSADHFPKVFAHFIDWLPNGADYIFATWGAYDLVQLNIDCAVHGMPGFFPPTTLNLKAAFKESRKLRKKVGLRKALEISNLSYQGNHHRALDDAKNTAKLLPLIFNDKKQPTMYEIIIQFEINDDSLTMDEIDNALFEAGFDDAIISHSGDGRIAIELSRGSTSYAELVESVVATVMSAIPSASVSQLTRPNPFKHGNLDNPCVDVTTSRIRSQKKLRTIAETERYEKLNIDALIDGLAYVDDGEYGYIVDIHACNEILHPARFFEALYLHKLRAQGLSDKELLMLLGLSYEQFEYFLKEKLNVTTSLAKQLEAVTGMPSEFWLRVQTKFDFSNK